MSLPTAVLIKSESYLAKTKSEHPTFYRNNFYSNHCRLIIDWVIITTAIRVPARVNTITAIMEQIHQCQSIGRIGGATLIL